MTKLLPTDLHIHEATEASFLFLLRKEKKKGKKISE
jgi:hypothetical protein